jgi:hypothetical protein
MSAGTEGTGEVKAEVAPVDVLCDDADANNPDRQKEVLVILCRISLQLTCFTEAPLSTKQSRDIGSTFRHWSPLYSIRERDTSCKVSILSVYSPLTELNNRCRYVLANDLSPSATAAMKRNVEINGLGASADSEQKVDSTEKELRADKISCSQLTSGMVRITEGDAWYVISYPVLTTTERRPT